MCVCVFIYRPVCVCVCVCVCVYIAYMLYIICMYCMYTHKWYNLKGVIFVFFKFCFFIKTGPICEYMNLMTLNHCNDYSIELTKWFFTFHKPI